jgi:hypothetical protein
MSGSAARHPTEGPIFIVGCGRSGTTMFRLMLGAHPTLAIPGESHFIPELWRVRKRFYDKGVLDARALAQAAMDTNHFRWWEIPVEGVSERVEALQEPTFAGVMDAIFAAYAAEKGKSRWGDKTPIHVLSIPLLAELFPEARFVHMIRDGRDVALSYLSVPWGPQSLWQVARKWKRDVNAGRRAGGALGADRYMEIRYEDLIRDTPGVLEAVCNFTDLGFLPELLEHDSTSASKEIRTGGGNAAFHARAGERPKEGARNWRADMSEADVAAFEAVAGSLLDELGYGSDSRMSGSLRLRAATAMTGLEVKDKASKTKRYVAHQLLGRPLSNASV